MLESLSLVIFTVMLGIRHGVDADHVAAIADMVGSEQKRRKQMTLGILYAMGHGSIVFLIGLLALLLGLQMPEGASQLMEVLVALTLLLLGGYIFYSMVHKKKDYEFKGFASLIFQFVKKVFKKEEGAAFVGLSGAFLVGVIHGIGVESPTQLFVISNAAGGTDNLVVMTQLMLFVFGILLATTSIAFLVSYGFLKAQLKKKLYLIFGSVTGIYSIWLGASMLVNLLTR